ncbi:MAG: T9SS type A sorting domain-containing protein [Bacteroidota bacterium]
MNNLLKLISSLSLLLILVVSTTYAQPPFYSDCITWESLGVDSSFTIGKSTNTSPETVIFAQDEIEVRLDTFFYSSGGTGYENLFIGEDFFGDLLEVGPLAAPSNINLDIQFGFFNTKFAEICFNFYDGGGEVNLGINNSQVVIANNLFEAFEKLKEIDALEGIDISVDTLDFDFPAGSVCITGDVSRIIIGGQEMGINDICYQISFASTCLIENFTVEAEPCTPNGIFYANIAFDAIEPLSDGYMLLDENGDSYGTFSYQDSFPRIGPLSGDVDNYIFIIQDLADPNCAAKYQLFSPNCGNECRINDLKAEIVNCDDNGIAYDVYLNFQTDFRPSPNDFFIVYIDDAPYDTASYAELPLTLENIEILTEAATFTVGVCPAIQLDCCEKITLEKSYCNTPPSSCIGFEGLDPGFYNANSGYEPGDRIYEEEGVGVSLLPFQNLFWGTVFGDLEVKNGTTAPELPFGEGNYLRYEAMNTIFDFTQYDGVVERITIELELGTTGLYNLGVNGENIQVLLTLSEEYFNIGNNVIAKFEREPGSANRGLLTVEGEIQAFLIGGAPLLLDNLCINPPLECAISELWADALPCDERGFFYVDINFQHEGDGKLFDLLYNDSLYGQYLYSELPVQVGPFKGPIKEPIIFTVIDSRDSSCAAETVVDGNDCVFICSFEDGKAAVVECNDDDDSYVLEINLDAYVDEGEFVVRSEDGQEFSFSYKDLPVKVRLPKSPNHPVDSGYVKVCDRNIDECCIGIAYDIPCGTQKCSIRDFTAKPTECDTNGNFYVYLDFKHENTSGVFVLWQNSQEISRHSYNDLPLRVGPFSSFTDDEMYWEVYDSEVPNCGAKVYRPYVDCTEKCSIRDFTVKASECDTNGNFYVYLDFHHDNTSKAFVFLQNGNEIAKYEYDELPIKVGPYSSFTRDLMYLEVQDIENRDCSAGAYRPTVNCLDSCSIRDFVARPSECDSLGNFYVALDFEHDYNSADTFFLYENSRLIGLYSYEDLPLRVGPFSSFTDDEMYWEVYDGFNSDCGAKVYRPYVDCEERCPIEKLVVLETICYPKEGIYEVLFDIEVRDRRGSFEVSTADGVTEKFAYDELPVKIKRRFSDALIPQFIQVCDLSFPECCLFEPLEIDCPVGDCAIENLVAEQVDCDTNGLYFVALKFEYVDVGESFVVATNQGDFGPFPYQDIPVTVGPFVSPSFEPLVIAVIDPETGCQDTTVVEDKCFQNPGCNIYDLRVESTDCDSNGVFFVKGQFEYKNPGEEYYVATDQGLFGPFSYEDQPFEIGPFEGIPGDSLAIEVFDTLTFCGARTVIDVNCFSTECGIYNLRVERTDCDEAGFFRVKGTFDFKNVGEAFLIKTNQGDFGPFKYSDLPFDLGEFEGNDEEPLVIEIIDREVGCYANTVIDARCGGSSDCPLDEVKAETTNCNDGFYYVDLKIRPDTFSNSGFAVFINGAVFGPFEYNNSNSQLQFGPFEATGDDVNILIIDLYNPVDCYTALTLDAPDCEKDCGLESLHLEVDSCTANGERMIYVIPDFSDGVRGGDPFDVFLFDEYMGTFVADEFPVAIPAWTDSTANSLWQTVSVKALNAAGVYDCTIRSEIFVEPCYEPPYCDILDIEIKPDSCNADGSFFLYVDLKLEPSLLTVVREYDIYIYDEYFGRFGDFQFPVYLGPIKPQGELLITAKSVLRPDCQFRKLFEPPYCVDPCPIKEIKAEFIDCYDSGKYKVAVNLDYQETDSEYFILYDQLGTIGRYKYADLPIEVEVGLPSSEGVLYLSACDPNTNCCADTKLEVPDCPVPPCNLVDLQLYPDSCYAGWQQYPSIFVQPIIADFAAAADSFDVYRFDEYVGTFLLRDFPILIDPVFTSNSNEVKITVKSNAFPDCAVSSSIGVESCVSESCGVRSLEVYQVDCTDDGKYNLEIKPEFSPLAGPTDLIYEVIVNGEVFDSISTSQSSIVVGPFEGIIIDYITVALSNAELGCRFVQDVFVKDGCTDDECKIDDFNISLLECLDDNRFILEVDFEYNGDGNQSFDLYDRNGRIGFFRLDDLPILLEIYNPGPNTFNYYLKACINDNDTCCAEAEIDLYEYCKNDLCEISELTVSLNDCYVSGDTEYGFTLDFEAGNNLDNFLIVNENGSSLGVFTEDDLPLSFDSLTIPFESTTGLPRAGLFEIITFPDTCVLSFEVPLEPCPSPEVWPGDANADNIANHRDLIYIGVAFGHTGPTRFDGGVDWEANVSRAWNGAFANGINFQHADCNGDGVVDIADKLVIERNYGETRGTEIARAPLPLTDLDPSIFVEVPETGSMQGARSFRIPITLGTFEKPATDIYGFAFEIEFDTTIIDPSSIEIEYPNSWFGVNNVNILTIDKVYSDGIIEMALTRNDQNDVSGYGPIAYMSGIILDIAGIKESSVSTKHTFAVSTTNGIIPLGTETIEFKAIGGNDPLQILKTLEIYPNPVTNNLYFTNAAGVPIDELQIFDVHGRRVSGILKEVSELDLSTLPNGVYMMRMNIGGVILNRKIMKQ